MSEGFDFDAFEDEFNLDPELLKGLGESLTRNPKWADLVLEAAVADHNENCDHPECGGEEVFRENFSESLEVDKTAVNLGEITIELTSRGVESTEGKMLHEHEQTERRSETLGDDAQFKMTFNGRAARVLSSYIGQTIDMQKTALLFAKAAGMPDDELNVIISDTKIIDGLGQLLSYIGFGFVDAVGEGAA